MSPPVGMEPAGFVENRGQADRRAAFYLRDGGATVWITQQGIVFDLLRTHAGAPSLAPSSSGLGSGSWGSPGAERLVVTQSLVGASSDVRIEGVKPLGSMFNYLRGRDPARWRTGLRAFAEIVYGDPWDGIDVRLLSRGGQVEQEFLVRPRARPGRIRIAYRGIRGLRVARDGTLIVATSFGEFRETPPLAYQQIGGRRVGVRARFRLLSGTEYSFDVGPYSRLHPLVIDPTLTYSTFLGGTGGDRVTDVATDRAGNLYVTGFTGSVDFPTTSGAFQGVNGDGGFWSDAFVAKLNPSGTALVYSTYLGGVGRDEPGGIAVDSSGSAYIAGATFSDYPTTPGSFQPAHAGGLWDGFVTKLSPDGSSLVYSSFLGGSTDPAGGEGAGHDFADDVAVDPEGNAHVVGNTRSTDFPVRNAFQSSYAGGIDGFVTKVSSDGSEIRYSSYFGGSDGEVAFVLRGARVAADAGGNAYVTGGTGSLDFPTTRGSLQPTAPGGLDAFVLKLAPAGDLAYSTYLGGAANDAGSDIAVDSVGHAHVFGSAGTGFPTSPDALKPTCAGDVFVAKLNASGSALDYGTCFGGSAEEQGASIALDASGHAHVSGHTTSTDLPTTPDAVQTSLAGLDGWPDAFFAKLNSSGTGLLYSTYLGGSHFDQAYGTAVDRSGDAYVAGESWSADFPTTEGALQPILAGGGFDGFVAKIPLGVASASVALELSGPVALTVADGRYSPDPFEVVGTARNDGGATARDVQATLYLPGGLALAAGSASQTVGTLAPGEERRLAWSVRATGSSENETLSYFLVGSAANVSEISPAGGQIGVPGLFTVAGATPSSGGNAGQVTIEVLGSGFKPGAVVRVGDRTGQDSQLISSQRIRATIDLRDHEPRTAPLRVTNPDGTTATAPDPFTVVEGGLGRLSLDLLAPPRLRLGAPRIPFQLTVTNDGLVDIEQILLELTSSGGGSFQFADGGDRYYVFESRGTTKLGLRRLAPGTIDIPGGLPGPGGGPHERLGCRDLEGRDLCQAEREAVNRAVIEFLAAQFLAGLVCKLDPSSDACRLAKEQLESARAAVENARRALQKCLEMNNGHPPGLRSASGVNDQAPPDTSRETCIIGSLDPNDKFGPSGFAAARYVRRRSLPYNVVFENMPDATAPAQEVVVSDRLDPAKVDLETFALGPINFGTTRVEPPPGVSQFATDVDLRPANDLLVRINASLNAATGAVTWRFISLDPATRLPTEEPLAGFLPPNDAPPEGEGGVLYTVAPKAALATGAEIRNRASIIFDTNDPIETPEWRNTLDTATPTSQVLPLAAAQGSRSFELRWAGADEGAGVKDYTILVSEHGGPYRVWLAKTTDTANTFTGEPGRSYAFYSIAEDGAGNLEDPPSGADANTRIDTSTQGHDRTPPTIDSLSMRRRVFRVGARPTPVTARRRPPPRGSAFRFRLSEAATVDIRIDRALRGLRFSRRSCRPATRANTRKLTRRLSRQLPDGLSRRERARRLSRALERRRCTRYKRVGELMRNAAEGRNSVAFSGRIGRKALAPSGYRATLRATDAAGNRSKPSSTGFRVVR